MRAIEAIKDSAIARRVRGWTDRQVEIAFGAGLIVFVALVLVAGELAARAHDAWRGPPAGELDWGAVMSRMQPHGQGRTSRFPANTTIGHMVFNSRGFRGPDVAVPKPEGTVRIALLGDSKVFNAEYGEDHLVAARTAAALARRAPACRFDHVSIAGPAYTMADLAELIETDGDTVDPSVYVMLSGSLREVLLLHAGADADGGHVAQYPFLAHYSELWDKLSRAFSLVRQERLAQRRGPLRDERLAEIAGTLAGPAERVAVAAGDTPLLVIGYRGRLREGQSHAEQMTHTRALRTETRNMGAADLARLNTHLVVAMERQARRHGWTFIDPIADMAPTAENFVDRTHFTRRGIELFADALADALVPILRDGGRPCLQ